MSARRDPLVFLGLATVTIAAAIGSFGALRGTALLAGWSRDMSPLLPITVDATAAVASRVWLSPETPSTKARKFARAVALGSILISIVGNMVFHMIEAGYLHPGVWLVVSTGGISPIVLATVLHLSVLRSAVPAEAPSEVGAADALPLPAAHRVPAPSSERAAERVEVPAPTPARQGAVTVREERAPSAERWSDLLTAAEQLNLAALAATGKPAGIGKIRKELRVGQVRAQQLRDHLAALSANDRATLLAIEHANGVPVPA